MKLEKRWAEIDFALYSLAYQVFSEYLEEDSYYDSVHFMISWNEHDANVQDIARLIGAYYDNDS